MKFFALIAFMSCSLHCVSQDTSLMVTKEQKGILFISAYNFRYDTISRGDLINFPTFGDFFFPVDKFDFKILDKQSINFTDGIQLYYFKQRERLRENARLFTSLDTSKCYPFHSFYLLPVTIKFKLSHYNDFEACNNSYFDIVITGKHSIRFGLLLKTIYLVDIKN